MKKTDIYKLNQWELGDRIRMEDFNADNALLESILEAKPGRFQEYAQWVLGDGATSVGLPFYLDAWDDYEYLLGVYDLHETTLSKDDYFKLSLQYHNLEYSEEFEGPAAGTLMILLLPFHDKTAKIRGIFLADGCRTMVMDRTFEDLRALTLRLCNRNSTHYSDASDNTFHNPLWTVYYKK